MVNNFWQTNIEFIVTALLLIGTLVVYVYQYRVMAYQLRISRDAVRGQNTLSAIGLLQDQEAKRARWWVMRKLRDRPCKDWAPQDRFYASRACSRYNLVGMLGRLGIIPQEVIAESWAPSINRVYVITTEFRNELKRKNGDDYWRDFDWLYEQALRYWSDPAVASYLDELPAEPDDDNSDGPI